MLLNSFVQSQFSYSPLVWMLHSKSLTQKINKTHHKFLKVLHNDYDSTFEQLLLKEGTFTIHQINTQKLMIEIYKSKNEIGPKLLKEIFKDSKYKGPTLRTPKDFRRDNIETKNYGERSLSYFGSKVWRLLPIEIREADNLETFKKNIKGWKLEKCPCYLCKDFLEGVGLVDFCQGKCCKNKGTRKC